MSTHTATPFRSKALMGKSRQDAELAYATLHAATPTDAEVILLETVTGQRSALATMRRLNGHAPCGIIHPGVIAMVSELLPTMEARLDEATRCLLAIALGTRGMSVHTTAPVDHDALVDALADVSDIMPCGCAEGMHYCA